MKVVLFVHVDGHDGVGKTTLCKSLVETMENLNPTYVKFPTVYPEDWDVVDERYFLEDMQKKVNEIQDGVENGSHEGAKIFVYVLDRSFLSTAVYQGDSDEDKMRHILRDGLEIFNSSPLFSNTCYINLYESYVAQDERSFREIAARMGGRTQENEDTIDLLPLREKEEKLKDLAGQYVEVERLLQEEINQADLSLRNRLYRNFVNDEITPEEMLEVALIDTKDLVELVAKSLYE